MSVSQIFDNTGKIYDKYINFPAPVVIAVKASMTITNDLATNVQVIPDGVGVVESANLSMVDLTTNVPATFDSTANNTFRIKKIGRYRFEAFVNCKLNTPLLDLVIPANTIPISHTIIAQFFKKVVGGADVPIGNSSFTSCNLDNVKQLVLSTIVDVIAVNQEFELGFIAPTVDIELVGFTHGLFQLVPFVRVNVYEL